MKNEISIVKFNNKVPLSFSVINFDSVIPHMHASVQLLIVLDGEIEVTIDEDVYLAHENDIFIINPKTNHKLKAVNKATVLSTLIDQNGFGLEDEVTDNIQFNLNSMVKPDNPRYETIRYIVYSIIVYNSKTNINSVYTNRAIAYSLFAQLMNDFRVDISESKKKNTTSNAINIITGYINDHYTENITLNFLSEHFNYSNAYLSRLFKSSLDTNFQNYYDELRINYSLNDLLFTSASIEEIAVKNGFDNARSYVRAFLSIYKEYPSDYRKEHKEQQSDFTSDTNVLQKEALDRIIRYYNDYNSKNNSAEMARETEELIETDLKAKEITKENPITKILKFGDIHFLSERKMLEDLSSTLNDIPFQYIELTNLIGNDYSSVIKKDIDFTYYLNAVSLDNIMALLKELGIKPYFRMNFSYNKMSLSELDNAVNLLFDYLCANYQDGMKEMMFSIDIKDDLTKLKNTEITAFFSDVLSIYERIGRKSEANIFFGAPSFNKADILNHIGLADFISISKSRRRMADFYPIAFFKENENPVILKDGDALKNFIKYLKENDLYFDNKMYFENISFTNKRNYLYDTLYYSCYIIKNVIDNYKSIGSYANDFSDYLLLNNARNRKAFSGSNGLLTYNSLKKASYSAFAMLSKLPNQLIKKGRNFLIAKDDSHLCILLNNYNHYSDLYAENEYYEVTENNRYNCFPTSTSIRFSFVFDHLDQKAFVIKKYYISKDSASSYDIFQSMDEEGSMLSEKELKALNNLSEMKFKIEKPEYISNMLNVKAVVAPFETILIVIIFSK